MSTIVVQRQVDRFSYVPGVVIGTALDRWRCIIQWFDGQITMSRVRLSLPMVKWPEKPEPPAVVFAYVDGEEEPL